MSMIVISYDFLHQNVIITGNYAFSFMMFRCLSSAGVTATARVFLLQANFAGSNCT